MKPRGWSIEKAADPRPPIEVLAVFFSRLEQVLASRVGAGQPMSQAFDRARWSRELEGDLLENPVAASAIIERVEQRLATVADLEDLRRAFGTFVTRTKRIAAAVEASAEEPSPHILYRLFTAHGALLYVGITDRGPQRWVEHARSKAWWHTVARFEIRRYPTREAVAAAEKAAIIAERPVWNLVHNDQRAAG